MIPHIIARISVTTRLLFQAIREMSVMAAQVSDTIGDLSDIVGLLWPISGFLCHTSGELWQTKNELSLVIEMLSDPDLDFNGLPSASR